MCLLGLMMKVRAGGGTSDGGDNVWVSVQKWPLCDLHPGCLQCVQVGEGGGAMAVQHLCSHSAKESFVMGSLTCSMWLWILLDGDKGKSSLRVEEGPSPKLPECPSISPRRAKWVGGGSRGDRLAWQKLVSSFPNKGPVLTR